MAAILYHLRSTHHEKQNCARLAREGPVLSRCRRAVLIGLAALVASVVFSGDGVRVVAESTNVAFKATGNIVDGRSGNIAVLLANRKVLVTGSTRSDLAPNGLLAELMTGLPSASGP